jgi:hypothetical protein
VSWEVETRVREVFTLFMKLESGWGEAYFVMWDCLVAESLLRTRVCIRDTLPMGVIMFLKGDSSTLVAALGVWWFKV